MKRMIASAALLAGLSACSSYVQDQASRAYDPVYPVASEFTVEAPNNGGIYSTSNRGLFVSDRRAAQVGDVLTVELDEQFSASKSQSASGSRSNAFDVDLPLVMTSRMTDAGFDDARLGSGTDQSFNGQGAAQQSNTLSGRMTVIVVRVLPGGNLEIMGQKRLRLNNGDEYVRLTGVVRSEDISADNVVTSDRIANADIHYIGAGDVADTARPGWWFRALSSVSPL